MSDALLINRGSIFQLGDYELTDLVGQGAIGQVWHTQHEFFPQRLATKLLNPQKQHNEHHREAFANEFRAMTRLDHPGIVQVLDAGVLDDEISCRGQSLFPPQTPYIVMEFATHGSLANLKTPVEFDELAAFLFIALHALGHAHARGVIHRDIKPENILLGWPDELCMVRLSDFGLSSILGHDDVALGWGTPQYMAPEQVRGRWREQGPWTDLFSLGCVAHELATGEQAFIGEENSSVPPQLGGRRAPWSERPGYPDKFADWLDHTLASAPRYRFENTADAAWALARVCGMEHPPSLNECNDRLYAWLEQIEDLARNQLTPSLEIQSNQALVEPTPTLELPIPPIPEMVSWRDPIPTRRAPVEMSANLHRHRSLKLIGHEPERDFLWHILEEVRANRTPHAIVLRGQTGVGKTGLATWFAQRVQELGLADVMFARYSDPKSPFDGLLPMLSRYLGCQDLDLEQTRAALQAMPAWLRPRKSDELDALAKLIARDASHGLASSDLSHLARYEILGKQLKRQSQRRPLLIIIDNSHLSAEALFFLRYLMRRVTHKTAILFLLTMRESALSSRQLESALFTELESTPGVLTCELTPLREDEIVEMIETRISCVRELSDSIAKRSSGMPSFAMQLLDELIEQGALERTPDGYTKRPDHDISLPHDHIALWALRLERYHQSSPDDRVSLEIAAALGIEVSRREWRMVCEHYGTPSSSTFIEHWERAGLVSATTPQSFSLASPALRDALEARAKESGRWASINSGCAHILPNHHYERRARHHIDAGATRAALDDLVSAARYRLERGELLRTHRLLDQLETILNDAESTAPTSHHAWTWTLRSACYDLQGRYIESCDYAERAIEIAEETGALLLCSRALLSLGFAKLHQGSTEEAEQLFAKLTERSTHARPDLRLRAQVGLGRVAQRRGRLQLARHILSDCLDAARARADKFTTALCFNALGDIDRQSESFDEADVHSRKALQLAEEIGHRVLVADCLNDLAELSRMRGEYERAVEYCQRSIAIFESVESRQSHRARLELAYVSLGQRHFERARVLLERLSVYFHQAGDYSQLALAVVGMLPVFAQQGDVARLTKTLEHARVLLAKTERRDRDVSFAIAIARQLEHIPLPPDARQALDALISMHTPVQS